MVKKDIITAKITHIQRALTRLNEKQPASLEDFLKNRDTQDIVLLNMQTAIQGCIDIASHIISDSSWGVPGSLAGLFDTLCEKKVITANTKEIMRGMAGFRNLIVHEYVGLDMTKVYEICTGKLADFNTYLKEIAAYAKL